MNPAHDTKNPPGTVSFDRYDFLKKPILPTTPEREALEFARETLDEARTYCQGPQWSPSMDEQCARAVHRIESVLAASPAAGGVQPPYPEGIVNGPCVCGSWPGGECLRCEWRPATPPAAPAQAMPAPSVPESVLAYIHAYGDARADDDGTSPVRLAESILAIRRWAATLASQEGAAK